MRFFFLNDRITLDSAFSSLSLSSARVPGVFFLASSREESTIPGYFVCGPASLTLDKDVVRSFKRYSIVIHTRKL